MTSRRFTNALNAKLRIVIQREHLFGVYARRAIKDRDARNEARLRRALDWTLAALCGGILMCILIMTGAI